MPDIADADFCDWFSQKFTNDGVRLDLLESYKKNIYGISTLELVEGSAVAFQELVTHSPDANIHNFSENGIYRNAYHYFLIHNEEHLVSNEVNKIIFLYLCYTALYFGSASKLHYGAEWGDPVKLFIHLCQFVKKYQKLLSVTPSVLYHQYDNFKNINKRKGSYSLKEFTINSISNRYIKDLPNKLPKEKLLILSNHINLLKIIKENICDYFFQNNVQHMRNVRKHLDRKMKPLNQFLTENIPLFGNYYFPAFLYSDVDISHKFINLVGNNGLSNVIVQTTNGKSIENDIDTALLKCMKDFKDYIQKGAAWCCEKHGFISSKRDMINCTEEDSLRQRLKMFGQHIELKNLVLFE